MDFNTYKVYQFFIGIFILAAKCPCFCFAINVSDILSKFNLLTMCAKLMCF